MRTGAGGLKNLPAHPFSIRMEGAMSRWQIVDAAVTVAGVALLAIGVYMIIAAVGSYIPMSAALKNTPIQGSSLSGSTGINMRMLIFAPLLTGMLLFIVGILTCALSDKIATMFRPDGDGS